MTHNIIQHTYTMQQHITHKTKACYRFLERFCLVVEEGAVGAERFLPTRLQ